MREETIRCDVCKKVKEASTSRTPRDKWLRCIVGPTHITIFSLGDDWEEEETEKLLDICSDTCLQVELVRVLERIRK